MKCHIKYRTYYRITHSLHDVMSDVSGRCKKLQRLLNRSAGQTSQSAENKGVCDAKAIADV